LFDLGLGPIALAFCGASGPAAQRELDHILDGGGQGDVARRLLEARAPAWASFALDQFPVPQPQEGEKR
jgi:type IV secretion system protein VirB4